ncbi:hypothetical protein QBC42DRAFT_271926 [Cladorrhinum samala]|uniref:Uncharacterized protein n=1 Tax=Cladorrhinum samala TaxID=585594 RepID=A0AAV9HMQ9_9PEZI|nr:hypothetical protein QBC42DRAFT_271926 [Cladorrhinum samala]
MSAIFSPTTSSPTSGRGTPDSESELPGWDFEAFDQIAHPADILSNDSSAMRESLNQIQEMTKDIQSSNRSGFDELNMMLADMRQDHSKCFGLIKQSIASVTEQMTQNQQKHDNEVAKLKATIGDLTAQLRDLRSQLKQSKSKDKKESISLPAYQPPNKETAPSSGQIYMITDAHFQHALTIQDGQLKLINLASANTHEKGSYFWHCVENNGWLGFRNAASATYLGQNGFGGVIASAKGHKQWEQLSVRYDSERGGYLLMIGWWGRLAKIGNVGGAWRLMNDGEPLVWGFIQV